MSHTIKYLLLVILISTGCSAEIEPNQVAYKDWTKVQPGVQFKQVLEQAELFDIIKIDPTKVDISVKVDETTPLSVADWQTKLDATVVINGSYFDEAYQLVTRTQTNDQTYGPLLTGQTGAFYQVASSWQLGNIKDVALSDTNQLIQSYPILVEQGEALVEDSNGAVAQRTVVALDASGKIYFIIAEHGVLTLQQMATIIAAWTEPNIETALNLDGGTSTGLVIASDAVNYSDDSFVVPSVIVLH
ncbi:MAG: phosphodiester glycosidase family protein [Patescibacteria group bacterium]|jgi:exopolysaccharide biosynthesis protein